MFASLPFAVTLRNLFAFVPFCYHSSQCVCVPAICHRISICCVCITRLAATEYDRETDWYVVSLAAYRETTRDTCVHSCLSPSLLLLLLFVLLLSGWAPRDASGTSSAAIRLACAAGRHGLRIRCVRLESSCPFVLLFTWPAFV